MTVLDSDGDQTFDCVSRFSFYHLTVCSMEKDRERESGGKIINRRDDVGRAMERRIP